MQDVIIKPVWYSENEKFKDRLALALGKYDNGYSTFLYRLVMLDICSFFDVAYKLIETSPQFLDIKKVECDGGTLKVTIM